MIVTEAPSDEAFAAADVGLAAGALQKRTELARLLALYSTIVTSEGGFLEVGCDAGGVLAAVCAYHPSAPVVGVTLPDGPFATGRPLLKPTEARVIFGSSQSPSTVRVLEKVHPEPFDLVLVDADHSYDAVVRDVSTFWPWVRSGGVLALHDICEHPPATGAEVHRYWANVRHVADPMDVCELVADPTDWGGIGVIRHP